MLQVVRTHPNATLPTRGTPLSAGLDVYAIDEVIIDPNSRTLVNTHLCLGIPEGCYVRVAPRSGLALNNGIHVMAGVVDRDYNGEVGVVMYNSSINVVVIPRDKAIAQFILEKYLVVEVVEVDEIDRVSTTRGAGGYGSTDV